MDKLVKDSEKYLALERKLMDKLLLADEERNVEMFNILSGFFKGLKQKTDYTVGKLMSKYSVDLLNCYLGAKIDAKNVESIGHICLLEHIDRRYVNGISEELFDINSDVFLEEHVRHLYLVYIWYVQNHELDEDFKKALHNFMVIKLVNSEFMRYYYSGDVETANMLSDPDGMLGYMQAGNIALKSYFEDLDGLVAEANVCEMFDGISEPHVVAAKKKMIELEAAALSIQMNYRKIAYPFVDSPLSDYSVDIMSNASNIHNDYVSGVSHKLAKKPIYL